MAKITPTDIKPGATYADLLDNIEQGVVVYMHSKRGMTEQAFRQHIETPAGKADRESYNRKLQRNIAHHNNLGGTEKNFNASVRHAANVIKATTWSSSPDAGPQRPASTGE